jgi:hypothetical protein
MTAQDFIAKWSKVDLTERSAAQQHFLDLCELVGHGINPFDYHAALCFAGSGAAGECFAISSGGKTAAAGWVI